MATLAQLQSKIHVQSNFDGSIYIYEIKDGLRTGLVYSCCHTTPFDRIRHNQELEPNQKCTNGYTLKQAYQVFYNDLQSRKRRDNR